MMFIGVLTKLRVGFVISTDEELLSAGRMRGLVTLDYSSQRTEGDVGLGLLDVGVEISGRG
jgi:hypothetical protein